MFVFGKFLNSTSFDNMCVCMYICMYMYTFVTYVSFYASADRRRQTIQAACVEVPDLLVHKDVFAINAGMHLQTTHFSTKV